MQALLRLRYLTVAAIGFSAVAALLMFVMGAVTMVQAVGIYAGSGEDPALSSDAAWTPRSRS